MKTLSNYIKENQLVANIVRSELNRGREVYLVLNKRTGNTVVTSQPLQAKNRRNQILSILCLL